MSGVARDAIGINRDDQPFATLPSKAQQPEMAGMENIEITGNENRSAWHHATTCASASSKDALALYIAIRGSNTIPCSGSPNASLHDRDDRTPTFAPPSFREIACSELG